MPTQDLNNTPSNSQNGQPVDFENTISRLLKIVLKRWWIFIIAGLVAGLCGVYYANQKTVMYKSKLTFALDDGGGGGMGSFAGIASQLGLSVSSGKEIFSGDNILSIMKSRKVIERVLLATDTFNKKPYRLIEVYKNLMESGGKKTDIYFPHNLAKENFSYKQDSLLKEIYKKLASENITAEKPDKKLNIYEVNVLSPDEKFTKVFTDKLINETKLFYTEIRTKKAWETLQVLEDRVASMKGNLNASLSNRAAAQDANINPAFASSQMAAVKQQANIQAYGGAYNELFKNLEIARFQYLNEMPLLQIVDSADYPMDKIRLSKLKTGIVFSVVACSILFCVFWGLSLNFSKLADQKSTENLPAPDPGL